MWEKYRNASTTVKFRIKKATKPLLLVVALYVLSGTLLKLLIPELYKSHGEYHNDLIQKFNKHKEQTIINERQYYLDYIENRTPRDIQDDSLNFVPYSVNIYESEIPGKSRQLGRVIEESSIDSTPLVMHHSLWRKKLSPQQKWEHSYGVTLAFVHKVLEMGFVNPVIPFSWRDWYDFETLTKYKHENFSKLGKFAKLRTKQDPLKFLGTPESEKLKGIRGATYVYENNVPVDKLVFVSPQRNVEVKVKNINSRKSAVYDKNFGMLEELLTLEEIDNRGLPKGIKIGSIHKKLFEEHRVMYLDEKRDKLKLVVQKGNNANSNGPYGDLIVEFLSLPKLETRVNQNYIGPNDMTILLEEEEFQLDLEKRVHELGLETVGTFYQDKLLPSKHSIYLQHIIHRHHKQLNNTMKESTRLHDRKFFNEVNLDTTDKEAKSQGSHHDWRFFKKTVLSDEKPFILHRLFRAWQRFTSNERVIYWLSHGDLLGWRWQGSTFHWDNDIDLQLPIKQMEYLAANFNGSLIVTTDDGYTGRYFLEINPLFSDKYRRLGKNIIDGRFIDVDTGLYIDLTALSYKDFNIDYKSAEKGSAKKLPSFVPTSNYQLGDKNFHFYSSLDMLSPLRKTEYEGVATFVPFAIDKILLDEYREGLSKTSYRDYKFNDKIGGWIKKGEECETGECASQPFMKFWGNHKLEESSFCRSEPMSQSKYCSWFADHNTYKKGMNSWFESIKLSSRMKDQQVRENFKSNGYPNI